MRRATKRRRQQRRRRQRRTQQSSDQKSASMSKHRVGRWGGSRFSAKCIHIYGRSTHAAAHEYLTVLLCADHKKLLIC
jgi:hypothetical protein